ncbi:helix-turn-helix domain-containing protein [Bacteroidales bacterium OttesenSCG-928-K22]|nr:helix-turn-helix domain-containing protein [Bacteroidales bacterium OttesenSCG-928-K22]
MQHRRDSLRLVIENSEGVEKLKTYNRLGGSYLKDAFDDSIRDTVFAIFNKMEEEAIKQGNVSQQAVAITNRLTVLNNRREYDELLKQIPAALAFMESNEQWTLYYQLRRNVSETYRKTKRYEIGLQEAEKTYNYAKEHDHSEGIGIALYALASNYSVLSRYEEAEVCLRESIELLKNTTNYLNILPNIYNSLITSLTGQRKYEEALNFSKESENVIHRFEDAIKSPQPNAWYNIWIIYVDLFRQMNVPDSALFYADKVDSISGGAVKLYKQRGHILYLQGKYDEAIAMLDKAIEANPNGIEEENLKLMALIEQGKAKEAIDLYVKVIYKFDSIHEMNYSAQLDSIRTQYEVDKHIAEKEKTRNFLFTAIAFCILLIGGLIAVSILYRQKQLAYRNLVRISQEWAGVIEVDKPEENVNDEDKNIPQDNFIDAITENDSINETTPDSTDSTIMELIEELMKEKKLYNNPDLTINTLSTELGISKRYISIAINKCTGKNFNNYINEYRIKEAIRIMSEPGSKKYTIDSIAYDTGFNDRQTFHRIFKQNTGITPALFRANL